MPKLEQSKVYKLKITQDPEEEVEYEYYMCVGFVKDYFILNEIEQWAEMNRRSTEDIDLDEEYENVEELELKHFKKLNSLEALYKPQEIIEHEQPKKRKNTFQIV